MLVVDDESNITDLVGTALRYEGFDVSSAQRAGSPVRLVGWSPDLVVLDVMLPDIDGFEVTRRLRGDGSGAGAVPDRARHARRTRSMV